MARMPSDTGFEYESCRRRRIDESLRDITIYFAMIMGSAVVAVVSALVIFAILVVNYG